MKERLQKIKEDAIEKIKISSSPEALNDVRVSVLGKKGELTALLKSMKEVAPEDRPAFGQLVNDTRAEIERVMEEARKNMEQMLLEMKLKTEVIDVTLPAKKNSVGTSPSEYDRSGRGGAYLHRYGI